VKAIVTAGLMCAPDRCPVALDHHHDDQAEDRGNARQAKRAVGDRVADDRAAAGEDERECGEKLGERAAR